MNQSVQAECNICLNEFESQTYIPKILQCGHSLCLVCLKGICKDKQQITCHKCMQVSNINPDQAITNYGLLEILAQKQSQKQGKECTEHSLPKKFFCLTHQILVCYGCTLGDHGASNCNVKDFRNSYQEMIPKYASLLQEVQASQEQITNFYQNQETKRQNMRQEIDLFKQTIQKQTEEILSFLQENQKQMIQKADELIAKDLNFPNQDLEKVQNIAQEFQEIQKEQENDQRQELPEILERITKLQALEKKLKEIQVIGKQDQAEMMVISQAFSENLLQQLKGACRIELQQKQAQKKGAQEEEKKEINKQEKQKNIQNQYQQVTRMEEIVLFSAAQKLQIDLNKYKFYYFLEMKQITEKFQNQKQQINDWLQNLKQDQTLSVEEFNMNGQQNFQILGTFIYQNQMNS